MFEFIKNLFKKDEPSVQILEECLLEIVLEKGVVDIITCYTDLTKGLAQLYFTQLAQKLEFPLDGGDIFIRDLDKDTGFSPGMDLIIDNMLKSTTKHELEKIEIYNIIIKNLKEETIDNITWIFIGYNSLYGNRYVPLEYYPIEFVRKFRDKPIWYEQGKSIPGYSEYEKLPIEFVREFQDKLDWCMFGSNAYGRERIDEMPIEFIREFQDRLNWKIILYGGMYSVGRENLSADFVREFGHKYTNP